MLSFFLLLALLLFLSQSFILLHTNRLSYPLSTIATAKRTYLAAFIRYFFRKLDPP